MHGYELRNAAARHEPELYTHDEGKAGSSPIVEYWYETDEYDEPLKGATWD